MRTATAATILLMVSTVAPSIAWAQRFPFERSFQLAGRSTIDVSTVRGKIEIVAGQPGQIVVQGIATVRVGWDVPSNAVELAQQVATAPPIEHSGDTVRLRPPAQGASQRAVTVSYQVQVPPDTVVETVSDSGETTISGIVAPVTVRTQSGAIDLQRLAGSVVVSTGSGAVSANGIASELTVKTTSSSFIGSDLGSSFRMRSQSGDVDAVLTGTGDVDVETGSSAIRVRGLRGGLAAKTQSGRVTVEGSPSRGWSMTTGSSSVSVQLDEGAGVSLDAVSRSGSVVVADMSLNGSVTKRAVKGTINGGGPLVRINSGSGAIRIRTFAQ